MISEKYHKSWISENIMRLLTVVLVMGLAMLIVTPVAYAAPAQGNIGTVAGEVVAIDHVHNANTLTLRSSQMGQFPNDKMNIFVNSGTKINVCNSKEPLKDMQVDRNAQVTYHEVGGVAVASSISQKC